jgi:hypothetical protein
MCQRRLMKRLSGIEDFRPWCMVARVKEPGRSHVD